MFKKLRNSGLTFNVRYKKGAGVPKIEKVSSDTRGNFVQIGMYKAGKRVGHKIQRF
jgi:hypothetical protein